jgi:hypothetical protein
MIRKFQIDHTSVFIGKERYEMKEYRDGICIEIIK